MTIRLEHLTKSYNGKLLFEDLSGEFRSGEHLLLNSPSGSGKTTLLRIILGFEKPDAGRVLAFDEGGRPVRVRAGVVFQEDRLCPDFSAVENVRLANRRLSQEEIRRELSVLLPGDELDKPVRELSGGMKRRAALVRACLFPADLLLLDEPFTGLDAENEKKAARYLLEKAEGKLVIAAAHGAESLLGFKEFPLQAE